MSTAAEVKSFCREASMLSKKYGKKNPTITEAAGI